MIERNIIEEAAAHWDALAANEERYVREGATLCPQAATARAALYRKTAQSLRLELQTGTPHCACCLKPLSQHRN